MIYFALLLDTMIREHSGQSVNFLPSVNDSIVTAISIAISSWLSIGEDHSGVPKYVYVYFMPIIHIHNWNITN